MSFIVNISAYAFNLKQVTSPTYKNVILLITPDSLNYKLPDKNIVAYSENVYNDNTILSRSIDYNIDYSQGLIEFASDSLLTQQIFISYYITPDFLLQKYYLYEMLSAKDSLDAFKQIRKPLFMQNDNKLLISGTKTFSLTFSNRETFDLKQSLFLKLEGEISANMKIEGQLSDSQSPLTPEGDSRELSSLDQVYLKLYGKEYDIVFGDQELSFNGTSLMDYHARFEGINLSYHDKFGIQAALAANGGKSSQNIFQGVEGKQGPYYLKANTIEQNVMVVPGSERISINGERLNRGTDYSIDYTEGSISFKILITSNSRIIVDFQYSDDYYRQNLYLNSSKFFLSPSVTLRHHMIWQTDDKNNPLLWVFTASDKDSLQSAGDNTIYGQGIIEVDAGSGQYIKKIENGVEFYEYAVNDTTANYILFFSYVGYGKGDYEPFAPSKYKFKGIGMGSWMPYKTLIAPIQKSNTGMDISYTSSTFDVALEGMISNQDKNTLSSRNDKDNDGFITNSRLAYHPQGYKLNPNLSFLYQKRTKNTFTFSNLTPVDESYEFADIPVYDSLAQSQYDFSSVLTGENNWKHSLLLRYKQINSALIQKAIKSNIEIYQNGYIPSLNWLGIYSHQDFSASELLESNLHYHSLFSDWKWKVLKLRFNYLLRQNDYKHLQNQMLIVYTDNRYHRYNPIFILGDGKTYNSELNYARDTNEAKPQSKWIIRQSSDTWQFNQLLNSNTNMVNINYTHRKTENRIADSLAIIKKNFDLFDLKSSHQLWDNSLSLITAYQINQLEFYPQVRELQYIGNGIGLYDSTGTQITGGDYDYVYTNSGQSRMSSEITANMNLFFHLSQKYSQGTIWQRFRLDSGFQISENTQRSNNIKIYLLYPDEIFKSGSTIFGRQMMHHTIWLDIWKKVVTGNIKYEVNRTLDDRYQSQSKTFQDSKEIELDWQNVFGNQLQTSYLISFEKDTRYNSEINNQALAADLFRSINPSLNAQLSTSYAEEKGSNDDQSSQYSISNFKINPSISWYLYRKYRLASNLLAQFNKRDGSNYLSFIPDKRNGAIYIWSTQVQYKLNSFSSGSLEYSGKSYPKDDTIHEFKMEFRAEL